MDKDWVLGVQLDVKEAEKKIDHLESRLRKLNSSAGGAVSGGGGAGGVTPRNSRSGVVSEERRLKKILQLEGQHDRIKATLRDGARKDLMLNQLSEAKMSAARATTSKDLEKVAIKQKEVANSAANYRREVGGIRKNMSFLAKSTQSFGDSLKYYFRSVVSIYALLEGGRFIVNTTKDLQKARAALQSASGNSELAAADFEFAKRKANELGLVMTDTALSYGQFSVAAKNAGFSSEQSRDMFTKISESVASLSLSGEQSKRVFQGFQQVMSKGTLSMEEVKQQIGEQLPTALGELSEAMGYGKENVRAAMKEIESGTVMASDVMQAWADNLSNSARSSGALAIATNSLQARMTRFTNVLQETVDVIASTGIIEILGQSISVLGHAIKAIITPITLIISAFQKLFSMFRSGKEDAKDVEEGFEGVQIAGYALAALLTGKLALGAAGWVRASKLMTIWNATTGKSFIRMAAAATAAKTAIRSLMLATGVGALVVGGGLIAEKLLSKGDKEIKDPYSTNNNNNSVNNSNNNTTTNYNTFNGVPNTSQGMGMLRGSSNLAGLR